MDPFDVAIQEPIAAFQAWYEEAKKSEINDPNAMSLATATPDGMPSVRIVLMKSVSDRGFGFFTNRESQKGVELTRNPHAALCFHWKSLQRQVRVVGSISEVSTETADTYFSSRARISKIGAWASQQSRSLADRELLEQRTREFEVKFPDEVPRPPYWTGFVVAPQRIEFWQERPFRLHDRVVFERGPAAAWNRNRLFP